MVTDFAKVRGTLGLLLLSGLMAAALHAETPETGKAKRRAKPAAALRPGWKETVSTLGGFRVWLPGDPEVTNQEIKTPLGSITTTTYKVQQDGLSFNVAFNEYPALPPDPEKVLSGVREGVVKAVQGNLIGEKRISLGKVPGRDLEIQLAPQGMELTMSVRIYLSGRRLYQVQVAGPSKDFPQEIAGDFLESFQFVPTKVAAMPRSDEP